MCHKSFPTESALGGHKRHHYEGSVTIYSNVVTSSLISGLCLQVCNDKVCHGFASFKSVTPNMWHEHNVLESKQSFRRIRFILKHIKPSPSQPAFEQCRNKFRFINVLASPNVDENALWTQCINYFTIDYAAGFISQRARNKNRQYQPNCEISNIISQHVGSVGDPDASLIALRQINLVQTHTVTRHDFQFGQRFDQLRVRPKCGIADYCTDMIGILSEELVLGRDGPEPEEVESLVEMFFEVGRHWTCHQYAYVLHSEI
ncbi:hypothetical protein RJ640_008605 [Escallonia rubra]|uniref:C2H2-type domain-containing protein n=1 Tax=Escallonia rubra TaxID=112253 RepID=A0AA88QV59_9ASTE|nr:hypothetical protein RJ640_008605 [Escallonia rubra]